MIIRLCIACVILVVVIRYGERYIGCPFVKLGWCIITKIGCLESERICSSWKLWVSGFVCLFVDLHSCVCVYIYIYIFICVRVCVGL